MKKITLKEAKRLAIKKWEYIVGNNGDDTGLETGVPELNDLEDDCSYCHLFYRDDMPVSQWCEECPLNIYGKPNNSNLACMHPKHPFHIWLEADEGEMLEKAKDVLELIKKQPATKKSNQ